MKKIAILYSRSSKTPYRESINRRLVNEVLGILRNHNHNPYIVEANGNWENTIKFYLLNADLVFNLCYGYENTLQHEVVKMLDEAGIKHNTSSYAEQLFAQDKFGYYTRDFKTCLHPKLFDKYEDVPVIKKLRYGAASRQMEVLTTYFEADKTGKFIYQEFIKGKEYTVAVFNANGYNATSIGEKHFANEISFSVTKTDYEPSIPEQLKARLEQSALEIYNTCNFKGFIRIDFRVDKDNNIYLLDINAMPNIVQGSLCRAMIEKVTDFETFVISNVK